ncbi:MAG: HD-GYP domain-containing protein, partial [Actinobacteria bacterium]|nr:HD-GYP domain-containing protein [Actinomycetota bacterium]
MAAARRADRRDGRGARDPGVRSRRRCADRVARVSRCVRFPVRDLRRTPPGDDHLARPSHRDVGAGLHRRARGDRDVPHVRIRGGRMVHGHRRQRPGGGPGPGERGLRRESSRKCSRFDPPRSMRPRDHSGKSWETGAMGHQGQEQPLGGDRWRRRLVSSWFVRLLGGLGPLAASIAAGMLVNGALPDADGTFSSVVRFVAVFVASVATLIAVDRFARRLLPLGLLLRLSLTFPDRSPSRLTIALRASNPKRLAAATESLRNGSMTDAETIVTLAASLNSHDRRTRGHSERVRAFSDLIGQELKLSDADGERLRWAAFLHDIGKLTVPAKVLNKPGKLDSREWSIVRGHPAAGLDFAEPLRSWLGDWVHAVDQHHEKYDGSGYPDGLEGDEISMAGRIVAVADSFETMTAVRSYNRPKSAEEACAELARCAGAHFDPHVVRAMVGISIGRLRWKLGAVSCVAQIPFIGVTARAGAQVVTTAAGVEAGAGSALGALAVSVAGVATPMVATPMVATASVVSFTGTEVPVSAPDSVSTSNVSRSERSYDSNRESDDDEPAGDDTTDGDSSSDGATDEPRGSGRGEGSGPGKGAGRGAGGPGEDSGPGNGAGQGDRNAV